MEASGAVNTRAWSARASERFPATGSKRTPVALVVFGVVAVATGARGLLLGRGTGDGVFRQRENLGRASLQGRRPLRSFRLNISNERTRA